MTEYSYRSAGERFQLPEQNDYALEVERLREAVQHQRSSGREIVVVTGVGFVGAVMAAVVADAEDGKGHSTKFVIGIQRPMSQDFSLIETTVAPGTTEQKVINAIKVRPTHNNIIFPGPGIGGY